MLFHVGALWRLNELGYLKQLTRVSSVSGGSIAAAVLGQRLEPARSSRGRPEGHPVAQPGGERWWRPLRALAGQHARRARGPHRGACCRARRSAPALAAAYRRHLFGAATLQDLPSDEDGPRFVINATNLQSGVLWRFSRPYVADYRVGMIAEPTMTLADAVAASSAFPPVARRRRGSRFAEDQYVAARAAKTCRRPPFTTRPTLADGGVYDNLGLETAWKTCKTVLVSDGGGAMDPDGGKFGPFRGGDRWRDWGTQMVRVTTVIDNQSAEPAQTADDRAAIGAAEDSDEHRLGTYWGIRSDIANFELPTSLEAPVRRDARTRRRVRRTRLARLDAATQELLINWGYAICDAGMRQWVDENPSDGRAGFPYPASHSHRPRSVAPI